MAEVKDWQVRQNMRNHIKTLDDLSESIKSISSVCICGMPETNWLGNPAHSKPCKEHTKGVNFLSWSIDNYIEAFKGIML